MSAHTGKTVTCYHDGDRDIIEADVDGLDDDPTTLTFEDHGQYVSNLAGSDDTGTDLRERFQQSALRFTCPDCGRRFYKCPVCSDPDENTPSGWFRGESSGEQIACHNCNAAEAARQTRRGRGF